MRYVAKEKKSQDLVKADIMVSQIRLRTRGVKQVILEQTAVAKFKLKKKKNMRQVF